MKNILVIGAGISGLVSAYWLKKKGLNVTLVEKENRAGGVIQTIRENGYMFECGPNSFLDNAPETLELCDLLNLDNELLKQSMRGNPRYIYLNGKLNEVPTGPGALFKSELFPKKVRRRLYTEPFRRSNRNPQDESLADFVRRRLGDKILQNIVTPFVSGVYAGDPEKLSLRGTFSFLYDLERNHGSLFRGMLARMFKRKKKKDGQPEKKKPRAKNLCSFVDGLQVLPDALVETLSDSVRFNTTVKQIRPCQEFGYDVTLEGESNGTETFDGIVFAVPAYVLPSMLSDLLPNSCEYWASIPYNRLSVVCLSFKKDEIEHDCHGFGFLVPRGQEIRILGSIWSSSLFARRAPAGERSFTVFIGGGLDPEAFDLSEEELIQQAITDLSHCIGISGQPTQQKVIRWERAIPQYPIGHVEKTEEIKKEQNSMPGLFFTGNYLDGVSVNDCIRNAKSTAEEVTTFFTPSASSEEVTHEN